MGEIQAVNDHKEEIQFWLDALSQSNLDKETISLLNNCLQMEIRKYINPHKVVIYGWD